MYPKLTSESVRIEQEELDIRTLHLLRATVHNEERKLPENWEENPSEHKKYIRHSVLLFLVAINWLPRSSVSNSSSSPICLSILYLTSLSFDSLLVFVSPGR